MTEAHERDADHERALAAIERQLLEDDPRLVEALRSFAPPRRRSEVARACLWAALVAIGAGFSTLGPLSWPSACPPLPDALRIR